MLGSARSAHHRQLQLQSLRGYDLRRAARARALRARSRRLHAAAVRHRHGHAHGLDLERAAGFVVDRLRGAGGVPDGGARHRGALVRPCNVGAAVSQTARLTNTGAVPVALDGVSIFGGAGFSHTACPSILQPGAGCTVTVTFSPTTSGQRGATLRFDDDGGGPHEVLLDGTGSRRRAGGLPEPVAFGTLAVGGTTRRPTRSAPEHRRRPAVRRRRSRRAGSPTSRSRSDGCTGAVVQPAAAVRGRGHVRAAGDRDAHGDAHVRDDLRAGDRDSSGTGVAKPVPVSGRSSALAPRAAASLQVETGIDAVSAASILSAWDVLAEG